MGYRRYKGNQEQGKKEKSNHKPWNNTSQNKSLTDAPDAMPYMIKGMIYDLKYSPSMSWKYVTGSFSTYFRIQLKPAALASSCKGLAMTIYITLRRGEAQVQYSNPLPPSVQELMPYQQHRRS